MELRASVEAEAAGLAAERARAPARRRIVRALAAIDAAIKRGESARHEDFAFHLAISARHRQSAVLAFPGVSRPLHHPAPEHPHRSHHGDGQSAYLDDDPGRAPRHLRRHRGGRCQGRPRGDAPAPREQPDALSPLSRRGAGRAPSPPTCSGAALAQQRPIMTSQRRNIAKGGHLMDRRTFLGGGVGLGDASAAPYVARAQAPMTLRFAHFAAAGSSRQYRRRAVRRPRRGAHARCDQDQHLPEQRTRRPPQQAAADQARRHRHGPADAGPTATSTRRPSPQ